MLNLVAGSGGKYAATIWLLHIFLPCSSKRSHYLFFCSTFLSTWLWCLFTFLSLPSTRKFFFWSPFFPYSLFNLILIFFPLTICTGARTTVFGRVRGGIRAVWIKKRGREGIRVSRSWLREVWQGCRVKVKILEINSCFQQGSGMGMEGWRTKKTASVEKHSKGIHSLNDVCCCNRWDLSSA